MGGGGGSPPTLNSQQTAKDQTASNLQTAAANAFIGAQNQVTPYGNLTYKEVPGRDVQGTYIPQFEAHQELSQPQQQILEQQQNLQGRALNTAGQVLGNVNSSVGSPLNFSGFQNISSPSLTPASMQISSLPQGDQKQFLDQAYNALKSRATEDLNTQMGGERANLANQGVAAGSDAYNRAFQPFMRANTDISNQALINATGLAGQNIDQQGNLINQQGNLINQQGARINQQGAVMGQEQGLRQQQIQEMLTQHNQPLSDYSALMGFGGGVTQPNWTTPINAQVQPTDVTTPALAAYQGQQNAYNQQQSASNSAMGGLFGLGGSLLGGGLGAAGRAGGFGKLFS